MKHSSDYSSQYDYPWWVAVVFVTCLIFSEYFIYMYFFMRHMIEQDPIAYILIFIIFQTGFVFLVISYYKSVRWSPGNIPQHINELYPNIEEIKEKAQQELEKKLKMRKEKYQKSLSSEPPGNLINQMNGKTNEDDSKNLPWDIAQDSYCFKCSKIKTPRAHHCKECRTCILRMDHHCVWVGNCVGLLNHKFFILFLFYATFCLTIIVITILWNWAFQDFNIEQIVGKKYILFVTINCASSFAIALAVGYLFGFQIWSIHKNITTIEFHLESMKGPSNPFRKKCFSENAKEIFGNDIWCWALPVSPFSKAPYSNELQFFEKL